MLGIISVTLTCHKLFTFICCGSSTEYELSTGVQSTTPSSCYTLLLPLLGTKTDCFIRARFSRIIASALFLARGRWAVEYEGKICLENMSISRTENIMSESVTCSTKRQGRPPLVSHLGLRKCLKWSCRTFQSQWPCPCVRTQAKKWGRIGSGRNAFSVKVYGFKV
jgi:hypothetical protein